MAGRKFADVPKCSNFSSSQSPGWDQEEARKLVEESAYLNPRPTLIFVRPAPNLIPTVSYREKMVHWLVQRHHKEEWDA